MRSAVLRYLRVFDTFWIARWILGGKWERWRIWHSDRIQFDVWYQVDDWYSETNWKPARGVFPPDRELHANRSWT